MTIKRRRQGPKSFKDKAKRPRGAGLVTRREFRQAKNLSNATLNAYRAGFKTSWKHAGAYMARKGIPRPGEFEETNIHAGQLWGTRRECKLTDKMAGEILERVYESGKVGVDQLKQVRHSMSYAYYLTTGEGGKNYPEVNAQWRSFNLATLPGVRQHVKPTKIPVPTNLLTAFNKPWKPGQGMSLCSFITGVLACHDTHVFGLRPNVDIKKVKDSISHGINVNEEYGYTDMKGGRSKLHLSKRGTRKWKVYRVCFCKDEHRGPKEQYLRPDREGNLPKPDWNTCCPLAAMEFMRKTQGSRFRCYAKWSSSQRKFGANVGDVASFANLWLEH